MRRRRLFPIALASLAVLTFGSVSEAGGDVKIFVLKEHGVGGATQAQPFVDKFVAIAAKKNG